MTRRVVLAVRAELRLDSFRSMRSGAPVGHGAGDSAIRLVQISVPLYSQ
jgi:hypothetical protein